VHTSINPAEYLWNPWLPSSGAGRVRVVPLLEYLSRYAERTT
jgi:hypothetical protein